MSKQFSNDIATAVYAAIERIDCPFTCAEILLHWGARIKQLAEKEAYNTYWRIAPIPGLVWSKDE